VSLEVKSALRLVARLVDTEGAATPADFRDLRDLGVTEEAIEDVIHVVGAFQIITRVADALEFDVPPWPDFLKRNAVMYRAGYR